MPRLRHGDAHGPAVGVAVERHRAAHGGQRQVGGEVVGVRAVLAERGDGDVDEVGPGVAQDARSRGRARSITPGPAFSNDEVGAGHEREEVGAGRRVGRGRAPRCACRGCRRGSGGWPAPPARPAPSGRRCRDGEPPGGSTLTTSAPKPASTNVASSARPSVRSSTRYGESMEAGVGTRGMIPRRAPPAPAPERVEGYRAAVTSGLRLEVAHAVLYVHDVERMIDFYTNTLGFEVTDRGPLGPRQRGRDRVPLADGAPPPPAGVRHRAREGRSGRTTCTTWRSGRPARSTTSRRLKKTLEADGDVSRGSCRSPTATPGRCTSATRSSTASRCSSTRRGTCSQPQGEPLDLEKTNDEIVEATRARFSRPSPGSGRSTTSTGARRAPGLSPARRPPLPAAPKGFWSRVCTGQVHRRARNAFGHGAESVPNRRLSGGWGRCRPGTGATASQQ